MDRKVHALRLKLERKQVADALIIAALSGVPRHDVPSEFGYLIMRHGREAQV